MDVIFNLVCTLLQWLIYLQNLFKDIIPLDEFGFPRYKNGERP